MFLSYMNMNGITQNLYALHTHIFNDYMLLIVGMNKQLKINYGTLCNQ